MKTLVTGAGVAALLTGLGVLIGILLVPFANAEAIAAPSAVERHIRSAMPNTKITSVRPAVLPGLFEVVAGPNVFYVDEAGTYLFIGSVYSTQTDEDLTAARRTEIQDARRVDVSRVPVDGIITVGKGSLDVYVFTDPGCGWCRRLHNEVLKGLHDVRVHHVVYPLSSAKDESLREAAMKWLCAKDPAVAIDRTFDGSASDSHAGVSPECRLRAQHGIDAALQFGAELGVQGTPTLIAGDGRMRSGYLSKEALTKWLKGV